MQNSLGIVPLANPYERLSFLISVPMKRLLLAVRNVIQIGAVSEVLPGRVHLAPELSLENNAIVRHPLRQIVVDLLDQPVVVANVPGDPGEESEHSAG